ncbi:uncharacterized protein LOC127247337 [Andrographis paniculata]|uniref:uncharacterized protein LOC127247337 n=1 Tax=Andrographis paniculata TaxID=175694 RepID=UPI0021E8D594|nr:uncharacterized protein LOC127247337 [Andrographis paniculata]
MGMTVKFLTGLVGLLNHRRRIEITEREKTMARVYPRLDLRCAPAVNFLNFMPDLWLNLFSYKYVPANQTYVPYLSCNRNPSRESPPIQYVLLDCARGVHSELHWLVSFDEVFLFPTTFCFLFSRTTMFGSFVIQHWVPDDDDTFTLWS